MKRTVLCLIGLSILLMCSNLEAKQTVEPKESKQTEFCYMVFYVFERRWEEVCESLLAPGKFKNCIDTMDYLESEASFFESEFGEMQGRISNLETTLAELEARAENIMDTNRKLAARKIELQVRLSKLNEAKRNVNDSVREIEDRLSNLEDQKQRNSVRIFL